MNTIKDLIKAHIDRISGVTVAYQYSEAREMHLLEIIPSHKIEDKSVFNAVQDIIDEYIESYPSEVWYVTSPESRIQMTGASEFVYSRQDVHSDPSSVNGVYKKEMSGDKKTTLIKTTISELRTHKRASTDRAKALFHDTADYAIAA